MTEESKRDRKFREKYVPYRFENVSDEAFAFLPQRPGHRLRSEGVTAFVRRTRRNPELRLEVLSHLRLSAHDRASALTGIASILFAALAIVISFSLFSATLIEDLQVRTIVSVILGIVGVLLMAMAVWMITMVAEVSRRSNISAVWLDAYKDALHK